jgi:hypothetical protein
VIVSRFKRRALAIEKERRLAPTAERVQALLGFTLGFRR